MKQKYNFFQSDSQSIVVVLSASLPEIEKRKCKVHGRPPTLLSKIKSLISHLVCVHLLCPPKPTHTFPNALTLPHSAAL